MNPGNSLPPGMVDFAVAGPYAGTRFLALGITAAQGDAHVCTDIA